MKVATVFETRCPDPTDWGQLNHSRAGTGKTKAAVLAYECLAHHGLTTSNICLIVCPVKLPKQWGEQVQAALPSPSLPGTMDTRPSRTVLTITRKDLPEIGTFLSRNLVSMADGDGGGVAKPQYLVMSYHTLGHLYETDGGVSGFLSALADHGGLDSIVVDEV